MDSNKRIMEEASAVEAYTISARRLIHAYAEIGGMEVKTNSFIRAELDAAGVPYETVADTGLIATFDTGKPGPGIALRADIDALPIRENANNLAGPRTCISENEQTCHACGHDAHAAMLLGSIKVLCRLRDELCGVIYFCFEEGEECGKGVAQMMEALQKRRVDTVWAIHVYAMMESGKINVSPGPRMAGAAGLEIRVKGKGGHSSRPDLSINPVFAAASIVSNIPGAFVNQLNPEKSVTYGVTAIQGAAVYNVFPDEAVITGSMRFFDTEEGAKAVDIVKNVAEHISALHHCTVDFGQGMKILIGPVINDTTYAEIAKNSLAEILPEGSLIPCEPWYASESFGIYLQGYKGVFAFLGIKNPEAGTGAMHHNEYFDVDEGVLKIGVIATVKYTLACMR